jgi:hypothetical protein
MTVGLLVIAAAVALWRLYFETGHWHRGFLIDRMTESGRTRRLPCVRFARGVGLDYYPAR